MSKPTQKPGFTLIELLFASALLGLMFTITLTTFIGVFRFYNWAKLTRTTQQSARELMDTITRDVRSTDIVTVSADTLCVNDSSGTSLVDNTTVVKSLSLQFIASGVEQKRFASQACSGPALDTNTVSNSAISVKNGSFSAVNGALGTPYDNSSQRELIKTSVIIKFDVINGNPDPATGTCTPGDNFCNIATFTTAVTEQ